MRADSRVHSRTTLSWCSIFRTYHSWVSPFRQLPKYLTCIKVLVWSEPSNRFSDSHHSTAAMKTLNLSRSASPEQGSGCGIFTPARVNMLLSGSRPSVESLASHIISQIVLDGLSDSFSIFAWSSHGAGGLSVCRDCADVVPDRACTQYASIPSRVVN